MRFLLCSRDKVDVGLIALNGVSPTEDPELDCDVAVAIDFLTIAGDTGVSCVYADAGEAGGVNTPGATFDWVLLIPITSVKNESSLKKRHDDEGFPPAPDLDARLRRFNAFLKFSLSLSNVLAINFSMKKIKRYYFYCICENVLRKKC